MAFDSASQTGPNSQFNQNQNPNQNQNTKALLSKHSAKSVLRLITCGSVDDGKSTLIGRLLAETYNIPADQLARLQQDSARHGTQGAALDYALLLDGLAAEREQGITIDVAYRFFSTANRKFIAADCPGHSQYTRNMATGASGADLAIVLVDARKGILAQTVRHSFIVSMFGVRQVILAVNKMDAIDFDQGQYAAISAAYTQLAAELGINQVQAIPLSALQGDNVTTKSARLPWYTGGTLLDALERAQPSSEVAKNSAEQPFRMPVQWVARPDQDFRGFAGTISSGEVHVGDAIKVFGTLADTQSALTVRQILRGNQSVASAVTGDSIMLTLAQNRDISRGDLLTDARDQSAPADQLRVRLLWMDEAPLREGQSYLLKLGTKMINARVATVGVKINVSGELPGVQNEAAQISATGTLALNEVAICELSLDQPAPVLRFADDQKLGALVLIDRQSHATVAAAVVDEARLRQRLIFPSAGLVSPVERAQQKLQTPRCYWLTGISGAGKSTLAFALDRHLTSAGRHVCVLDGDQLRSGLTQHLGFSDADRRENVRLAAQTARILVDAGLIVIVSLISPFAADRAAARALFKDGEFLEVFVDTQPEFAKTRDPKGLYALAASGKLDGLTGYSAPFEAPLAPELHLRTAGLSVGQLLESLLRI